MPRNFSIRGIPESTYRKLQKRKSEDGFHNADWNKWLNHLTRKVNLNLTWREDIQRGTKDSLLELWMQSFGQNLQHILEEDTITSLVPENPDQFPKGPAIVVGAGPSIYQHKHLEVLSKAIHTGKYKGIVCASDRMLVPCLEQDIIPHISVSVDGSPVIKKWYDHPIVAKYNGQVKACLNATVHPDVPESCRKTGAKIFWFNPVFDDYRNVESFTRIMSLTTKNKKHPSGVPAVSVGGNAGSATWVLAHSLLRRSPVALIGMDLGYPEDTPLDTTPYYSTIMITARGDVGIAGQQFIRIRHPFFKTYAKMDIVFANYRQGFREMVEQTPPWIQTINCTEGGTLWGPGIECMLFKDFLEEYGN
jgi:hypothetical protein